MNDMLNTTVEPRLIYNLESGLVSFDPPVPLPMGKRLGRAFDEMMDAIGKFREAMRAARLSPPSNWDGEHA